MRSPSTVRPRRHIHLNSSHLLAIVAIVLALGAPAGAALVYATGIASNAVQSRHIRNGQVRSIDIGTGQVANRNLVAAAVTGNKLAAGAVGATQVADGSLTGSDLADGSITAADLAPGTLPTFSIGAGAVDASMLASGAVGSAAISDGSVGTVDLATGAVTSTKVATGAIGEAEIGAGAVDSIELASGAVLTQHIGGDAVSGASLGELVGTSVTATNVAVPDDALDVVLATEEGDGHVVSWASDTWDSGTLWNIAAPTDVVVPTAGVYVVEAWVSWENDNDGYREAQVVVDGAITAQDRRPAGSGVIASRSNQLLQATVAASAASVVRLRISHSAGNALNADRVRMTVRRIGTLPA